ncbi:Qat anti-phage system TatD family nuclease QatD [Psychroserpens mesophilus]|uniref:Qat anti-phage system TatD family nuclease QatD n=1 Tax=Psychroserpens mesophilus TaxID=325473 RepID=UPI003D64D33B
MIDTHCHIDLYPNPERLLRELDLQGITVISMTNLPSHFKMGLPYFKSLKKIRLALGMHPLYAENHFREFPDFLELIDNTSYIGEVGLDFSREGISTKDIQIESFRMILKSLEGRKKIFSIHSRKAEREVLSNLIEFKVQAAIFHWYSGPINLINEIANAGFYFSINTAMLKSVSGQSKVSKIPKNKILTETDGPFIEYNGKPAKPSDVKEIIIQLSKVWDCTYSEANKTVSNNYRTLLGCLK